MLAHPNMQILPGPSRETSKNIKKKQIASAEQIDETTIHYHARRKSNVVEWDS